jgi:3-hydroxyisobutyrate dehydrogenase-like beta-hydroxyacid dehydrogenase
MNTKQATSKTATSLTKSSSRRNHAAPTVGVIGLGIMGSAMSTNLSQSGWHVLGYDTQAATRKRMSKHISEVSSSVAEMVGPAKLFIASLPSTAALMQVSQQMAEAAQKLKIKAGTVVLAETSTLPVADKLQASTLLAQAGIEMIDAPLSGTGAQAKHKDLTVYASGPQKAVKSMAKVFAGCARDYRNVGEFGNGMKMKMVANLLVAIHNVSTAEAILFGEKLGLDPKQVVDVVGGGAGGSRMFQVRGPMMVQRNWHQATMKNEIWQKDMTIIHTALVNLCVPAPLFSACLPIYHAAMAQGHALDDTASVYAVLERLAGGA